MSLNSSHLVITFSHSLTHSFIRLINSSIHFFIHSLIHLLVYSFIHRFNFSFIHSMKLSNFFQFPPKQIKGDIFLDQRCKYHSPLIHCVMYPVFPSVDPSSMQITILCVISRHSTSFYLFPP